MNHVNYFKDLFGSILDFRKNVLLIVLIKNDADLLHEGYRLKSEIFLLCVDFKNVLIKQNEKYLNFKNEEASFIEKLLK